MNTITHDQPLVQGDLWHHDATDGAAVVLDVLDHLGSAWVAYVNAWRSPDGWVHGTVPQITSEIDFRHHHYRFMRAAQG